MEATDVEVYVPEPMTNLHTGLTTAEVDERLAKYGKNEVVAEQTPWYMKVLVRYCGLVPIIMLVVSLLSATIVAECEDDIVATSCECKENRDWISFALLFFELNLIVWVDYLGEVSSGNAIEQLKKLSAPTTKVLRNGEWADLDKTLLVPGDIVGLVIGATVPSDGLLRGDGPAEKFAPLKIDAASVTGEPLPETKCVGDEVIAATTILTGELEMQVTHTGARSSIGKSMKLINEVGVKGGKLKTMLGNLARSIAAIAAVFCTLLFVVVVVRDGMQVAQAVKLSFVVLVAVLPVAMPVVITTGLAVGALELSRENAIVQRLSAIEEMAGMDILCSDKTGTLTKGKMAIVKEECTPFGDYTLEDLLQMSLLASRRVNTDPIDSAVCDAFPDTTAAVKGFEELQFAPFSPVTKKTEAKINNTETGVTFLVSKGAPEIMNALPGIDAATEERAAQLVDVQSAKGYKTLGVCKSFDGGESYSMVGYLSIMDEPRHDTKSTIENAIALGVQVKMITGDQKKIAIEVARKLGMGENIMGPEIWLVNNRAVAAAGDIGSLSELASGFASVKPEHKHKVVTSLQEKGHVVGMTGDGVNDAPALAVANVGIAVADATDAARGAADIVLTEEGLSTIITAIRRSRMIFRRLESYIVYRLASSVFILGFFLISIISLKFDFPTWCLILLSIVNDFTVMATSSDNVRSSAYPLYWDVPQLVVKALLIGGTCVLQAFLLLYFVQQGQQGEIQWLQDIGMHNMMDCEIVAVMYLNIAVCIQLNIFSARNKRFFFQTSEESDASPLPSLVLCVPVFCAVVLSTFLAVYWDADVSLGGGNPMKGCGWGAAGAVWVWCIVWFFIIEIFKVALQGVYDRPNDGVEELFQGPIGRMVEEQMGFGPKEGDQDSLALMLTRQNRNSVTSSNRTAAALALAAAGEEMPVDRLPRLDKVSTLSMLKTIDALRVHVHALERRLMAIDGHLVVEE